MRRKMITGILLSLLLLPSTIYADKNYSLKTKSASFLAGTCTKCFYTLSCISKPHNSTITCYRWENYIRINVLNLVSDKKVKILVQPVNENNVALGPMVPWDVSDEKTIPLFNTSYQNIYLKIMNCKADSDIVVEGYWVGKYYETSRN